MRPVNRVKHRLLSAACLSVLSAGVVGAQTTPLTNPKIDRALVDSLSAGARTQAVIVSVQPGFRDTLRRSLESHGDLITAEHGSIDAISAVVHTADIVELAGQTWVKSVALDAKVFAIDAVPQTSTTAKTTLTTTPTVSTTAPPALNLRETLGLTPAAVSGGPSGRGIGVAVIDSGLAPSRDLEPERITAFYNLTVAGCARLPGACATTPFDDLGHGTHVAGLIGSSGVLSGNLYQGVAPRVSFVGVKVLNSTGAGNTSDVIAAIEYVAVNRVRLGVRVINLSLGHAITMPAVLDPLVRVVQYASSLGITVVVAAGNNAGGSENKYSGITSPANAPSALTVGASSMGNPRPTATRADDFAADFSARGPTFFDGFAKPDFVAPGVALISDIVTGTSRDLLYNNPALTGGRVDVRGNAFLRLSGTSMSAAVASGVAALVLEAAEDSGAADHPLTPNAVKAILEYTAIPIVLNKPDVLTQGAGEINAGGAIALASRIETSTKLGGWWVTSGVQPGTSIGGVVYAWSQNIVWGNNVIGGDIVFRQLLIWSNNILWGTNSVWGNGRNILWGTANTTVPFGAKGAVLSGAKPTVTAAGSNIVWGNSIVDGVATMMVSGATQADAYNILWGTATGPIVKQTNIVWGNGGVWGRNLVAGRSTGLRDASNPLNVSWADNIVWGNARLSGSNIVWGNAFAKNILWGTWDGGRFIWGSSSAAGETSLNGALTIPTDGAVWTLSGGNILWGTVSGDNILWGSGYHAPF